MTHLLALACALSGDAFAGPVSVLVQGPVVADGASEALLQIYVEGAGPSDRVKVKPDHGKITTLPVRDADGTWTLGWTPEAVDAPGVVSLTVAVRGTVRADEAAEVAVVPPASGGFAISLDPAEYPVGGDGVRVKIVPSGAQHLPLEARRLQLGATVGTITDAVPSGDGGWVARYTAPSGLEEPVAALVTLTDLTAPEAVVGSVTIPVLVRTSQDVQAPAGSQNVLRVGDREYGPVQASPAGTAAFDMDVSPALTEATLVSADASGAATNTTVPVETGAPPQLAWAPLPQSLTLPEGSRFRFLLAASNADGSPRTRATPTISGPGNPSAVELGGGWYAVDVEVPEGAFFVKASLDGTEVSVPGSGTADLPRMALSTDPSALEEGTKTLAATARLKDAEGTALPGRKIVVEVEGASKSGSVRDNKDGTYGQKLYVKDDEVVFAAHPSLGASGLPPAAVRLWGTAPTVAAGDELAVRVVAVDAVGLPVPSQTISLGVPVGDGTLPPEITTTKEGAGLATYSAGSATGPVVLRARVGELETTAPTWQLPEGAALSTWYTLGTGSEAAALDELRQAMPVLLVSKAEPAPAVAVAAAPVATEAEPATTAPATTAPTAPAAAAPTSPFGTAPPKNAGASVGGGGGGGGGYDRWLSARFGFTFMSQDYDLGADGDGQDVPNDAAFSAGLGSGGFGGYASVDVWPMNGPFGLDARARALGYSVEIAGSDFNDRRTDWQVGGRYRYGVGGFANLHGGAWYHTSNAVLFRYEDETRTSPELLNFPVKGGRTGVGASVHWGILSAYAEGAVTWSPWPVDRGALVMVDAMVQENILVSLGYQVNGRSMTFEVSDSGTTVDVKDNQGAVFLTVGTALGEKEIGMGFL